MNITLTDFVMICVAGGVGSMARAGLAAGLTRIWHPAGAIFAINALGSFLIGVALGISLSSMAPFNATQAPIGFTFFAVGLLGGFTTVSTFALQIRALWREGKQVEAGGVALGSVLLCPLLALIGFALVPLIQGGG